MVGSTRPEMGDVSIKNILYSFSTFSSVQKGRITIEDVRIYINLRLDFTHQFLDNRSICMCLSTS